ncbi:M48 family peptidase [Ectothiorhodospiraceae bacterium BW-2]|nr:M48 family peptidase [Ectothiorhodospiraceae bacterium BW-2]
MDLMTQLFMLLIVATTLGTLYLDYRQLRTVTAHRERVPEAFAASITLQEHQKAADYTVAKLKLGAVSGLYSVPLLLFWTLGGGLQWLETSVSHWHWGQPWHGVAVLLLFSFASSLLMLPLSLYQTFYLEQRFGFNRTTVSTFMGDMVKQIALSIALGVPLLALILWLMASSGDFWWLWVWLTWLLFSLLMMWIYPNWIAPIFNKFEPLSDQALVQRIEKLLQRCQFNANGLFVMDGSRRSSHGNAYFSGFGRNKRIVFFDTLLKELTGDQLEAVLAHELGHFRRKHIPKRIAMTALLSLLSLALLGYLEQQLWFYQALGVEQPSEHIALLLFMLLLPLVGFFLQPLFALSSRKHEFEADQYAAEQSSAIDLISALVTLYRENAATLTPDPLYSTFHDSHPPAPVRIARLQQNSDLNRPTYPNGEQ